VAQFGGPRDDLATTINGSSGAEDEDEDDEESVPAEATTLYPVSEPLPVSMPSSPVTEDVWLHA
jgi:hypothetical protein